jgi:protein involved in polysaccharide export with SLBB domain
VGALPDQPISDAFAVDPDGRIDLGPTYGRVKVAGLTIDEAQTAIYRQLSELLEKPQVSVSLAFSAGAQQIAGKHLVGPDGRVNLGIYGTVYVNGMTIDEARKAIEEQLSEYLQDPQVVVDVASFNSKKYYVITRTAGRGDQVTSVSLTGNDRVLDALSKVGSLPEDSSNKIWISRPAPNGSGLDTILPVRWDDISAGKSTSTNHELQPGDRLFVVGGQPASGVSDPQANVELPPNKFLYSPYADMEVKSAPVRVPVSADRVEFSIDILRDRAQALAEYDAQRGKSPFLAVDAVTIRPALRALTGFGHIRMLSSPKLACRLGETATIELKADGKKGSLNENLKLSISPHRQNGGMFVQLKLDTNSQGTEDVVAFGVPMEAGQTVLIPVPSRQNDGKWGEPLYLAISRSKFGSELPASEEATYYRFSEPPTAE